MIATDLSKASSEAVDCIAHYRKDFPKEAKLAHIISVETAGGIEETLENAGRPVIEAQVETLKSGGYCCIIFFRLWDSFCGNKPCDC